MRVRSSRGNRRVGHVELVEESPNPSLLPPVTHRPYTVITRLTRLGNRCLYSFHRLDLLLPEPVSAPFSLLQTGSSISLLSTSFATCHRPSALSVRLMCLLSRAKLPRESPSPSMEHPKHFWKIRVLPFNTLSVHALDISLSLLLCIRLSTFWWIC